MDIKNQSVAKITSIFVVLEAAFLYYTIGLMAVGYRFGRVLTGWKVIEGHFIYYNPLKYFLGLGYMLRTLFPQYYYFWYQYPEPAIFRSTSNQTVASTNFMSALWIGLIIAAIITAVVYAIKLKGIMKAIPKAPLPTGEMELSVKKKSTDKSKKILRLTLLQNSR